MKTSRMFAQVCALLAMFVSAPSYAAAPNLKGATLACAAGETKYEIQIGEKTGTTYSSSVYKDGVLLNDETAEPEAGTVFVNEDDDKWALFVLVPPNQVLNASVLNKNQVTSSILLEDVDIVEGQLIFSKAIPVACTLTLKK